MDFLTLLALLMVALFSRPISSVRPIPAVQDVQPAQQTFLTASLTSPKTPPAPKHLYITTLALNQAKTATVLECWRFSNPIASSDVGGINGALALPLANLSTAEYTVIPPRFDGGLHNAPAAQFVQFVSGFAHISVPGSNQDAYVVGGKEGLLLALDTVGEGHVTTYPSEEVTIAITMKLKRGLPDHEVVGEGPCQGRAVH